MEPLLKRSTSGLYDFLASLENSRVIIILPVLLQIKLRSVTKNAQNAHTRRQLLKLLVSSDFFEHLAIKLTN